MMYTHHYHHQENVQLVPLGDQFALVDLTENMVYVVNAAAAWAWEHLEQGIEARPEEQCAWQAFTDDLKERGLVRPADGTDESVGIAPVPEGLGEPVLGPGAAMQVAAGTSDPNPYLCETW